MGIKTSIFVLIFLLFISCNKDEPTESIDNDPILPIVTSIGDTNKFEIVTWNIERFPKTEYSDDYVKTIIEGLDADFFVLQEIQSKNAFANMMNEINNYNYFLQTNTTGLSLGIIYKNDVVILKSTEVILEQKDHNFAGRPPLLANIEWQSNGITKELSIVNVHYKCCGDNNIDIGNEDDEEYRRLKATDVLEQYISENLKNKNVIVAGDFNDAINEVDSTNVFLSFLHQPNEYKFVDMDIATGDKYFWSWQGWSSSYSEIHFDHILINKNLFDEFENSAEMSVIKLEEYFKNGITEYDENVSDHRPVYFKFSP